MRIAIITLFYNNYNYGGVLQAFALQRVLDRYGQVEIINLDRSHCSKLLPDCQEREKALLKIALNLIKKGAYHCQELLCSSSIKFKQTAFDSFSTRYICSSKQIYNKNSIFEISECFDVYISGSDQVWSPVSGREETFLTFVDKNKLRVAYAASFGADVVTEDYLKTVRPYIKNYDYVSIREIGAKRIVDEIIDGRTELVLDPVLLAPFNWSKYEKAIPAYIGKKFALLYFIGEKSNFWKRALKLAKLSYNEIVNIPYNRMKFVTRDFLCFKHNCEGVGPAEFLWLIHYADIILTDSFHGVAFSIIFKKRFIVFNRQTENENGQMNGRVESLISQLGINYSAVMDSGQNLSDISELDYDKIESNLNMLRKNSLAYLEKAIHGG